MPVPPPDGAGMAVVDRFEVLDVDLTRGVAAVKVIEHENTFSDEDGDHGPYDCRYPGMKEFPTSGVTLGVWSFDKGALVESWTVYARATRAADCSPAPANEAALAAAKQRFAALGLDPTRRPAPIPEASTYRLPSGAELRATSRAWHDDADDEDRFALALLAGDRELYAIEGVAYEGIARTSCSFEQAYAQGARVAVVVHCHLSATIRSYEKDTYALTPVLDLGG